MLQTYDKSVFADDVQMLMEHGGRSTMRVRKLKKRKIVNKLQRAVRREDVQSNRISRAVAVKEELQKLITAVRGKFRQLRQSADDVRDSMEIGAKPFVEPLQKAVMESLKTFIPIKGELIERNIPKPEPVATIKKDKEEERCDLNKTVDTPTQTDKSTNLPRKYLNRIGDPSYKDKLDFTYGVYPDGSGGTLIGDSKISFTRSSVLVKGKSFKVTPGLLELLFMKVPNRLILTKKDLSTYKDILLLTNAHLQSYSSDKQINANRGKKYTTVISTLFMARPETPTSPAESDPFKGSGVHVQKQFTFYNANVNTLVNRLRLLVMSQSAGHTGHNLEVSQIITALRENRIIV